MDTCPTVELGVSTTHLKKKEKKRKKKKKKRDSPCSPKAKIREEGDIAI